MYLLAAGQGNASAQFNLGYAYANAQGVNQNYSMAHRLFRQAAGQGNANAQNYLGIFYRYGRGANINVVTAHMWLNVACSLSAENACDNRDELAAQLTPTDLSEAQRRARVCVESSYQDCD